MPRADYVDFPGLLNGVDHVSVEKETGNKKRTTGELPQCREQRTLSPKQRGIVGKRGAGLWRQRLNSCQIKVVYSKCLTALFIFH